MLQEDSYVNKIFQMVDHGVGLANPFGRLALADRDFLTFELAFFYLFIYDYRIFSQFNQGLRGKIITGFYKRIQSSRLSDFPTLDEIDPHYERRIFSYSNIARQISKMGEFGEQSAIYINTLVTFSEMKNVFTCYDFIRAEKELRPQIKPDKYTEELKVILTLSSSPLLTNGIDPTELIKAPKKNIFSGLFKR